MAEFVRNVAGPIGFEVETYVRAADFEAAVSRADPHTIVLDLSMPGTDGIELLRLLSGRSSRARIFIMSGFDPGIRQMAFMIGQAGNLDMRGIIPKPVRAAELRQTLAP
jgi:FixJ family two-component response regulator